MTNYFIRTYLKNVAGFRARHEAAQKRSPADGGMSRLF
jgi:hypothetical protein